MCIAEEVRFAEYRLAASLNEQRPGMSSEEVAVVAIDGSEKLRRRRLGRWIRVGLGIAAGVVFAAFWENARRQPTGIITETILLNCLTASQAAELATPYLRSNGTAIYRADDLRTLTIRAPSEELANAKMVIDRLDSPEACKLPAPTPAPATFDGKPGKD